MKEKRFLLFPNHLRLPYSIPKSFALLLALHVARHSFATLSLSHDIPIEKVARMLGHKDVKTTQIYAKVLKSTIANHANDLSRAII